MQFAARLKAHSFGVTETSFVVPRFIVLETHTWKVYWDLLMTMLILYSAIEVPIRLSFAVEATRFATDWWLDVLISLLFMADVGVNLNTAFLEGGGWITSRALIMQRYARGWLWIDAPSSVPIELVELALGSSGSLAALRLLRLFRLLRLLRLLKIEQYLRRLEEQLEEHEATEGLSMGGLRIAKLILKLLFLAHFLGCGWMATALRTSEEAATDDEHAAGMPAGSSWIQVYNGGVAADGPLSTQYLYSFYWALATLVGHDSNIEPAADRERTFATFAALLGALVFGTLIGEIGTLIASLDRQAGLVEERLDSVKEYLRWRQVPHDLSVRVRRYCTHFYAERAVVDEASILSTLSPSLRAEIVSHVLQRTLGRLPLFKKLSADFQVGTASLPPRCRLAPLWKPHTPFGGPTPLWRSQSSARI